MSLQSCHDEVMNPNKNLTLESFDSFSTDSYAVNSHRIREQLDSLIREDRDSMTADFRTRSYYLQQGKFLWIDRHGLDSRADTLLSYIRNAGRMGFSPAKFRAEQIDRDIERIRTLHVDASHNAVNIVLARLEYNLTKAYLRYTAGQRYGFMNPSYVFNCLDTLDKLPTDTSTHIKFRQLYDIDMEHAGRDFYKSALRKIYNDSVAEFIHEVEPASPLYKALEFKLLHSRLSKEQRAKVICNMERCRWRLNDYPQRYRKYVVVNIPSFRLRAVDGDDVITMRTGCGTFETKTPLLYSKIKRMDINPQWVMPRSIIEKNVVHHLGDRNWFRNRHYYVSDRYTGKEVPLEHVTWGMLMDKRYTVIQRGGNGNALGRIIFRFDNDFSVYLHDTDNRKFFSREDRGVSHGCVRIEKPFELAKFLLADKDESLIDKLHYSMTADIIPESDERQEDKDIKKPDTLNHHRIISYIKVEPQVPVFLIYYTIYPDAETGHLMEYPDVYGYDSVIYNFLRNYR